MTKVFPAGGLPIRMAVPLLLVGVNAPLLKLYDNLGNVEGSLEDKVSVQLLWSIVILNEMEGRICITGILPGEKRSETLERGLLLTSTANFQRNTISTDIGTISGVLVRDASESAAEGVNQALDLATDVDLPISLAAHKSRSVSYRQADLPLIQEMARLIHRGEADGPWDAALAVVGDALGTGTTQSKAKRLVGLFRKRGIQTVQG